MVLHESVVDGNGYQLILTPLVFAQQGYFVVAINPSGSTTFGQGMYIHRSPQLLRADSTLLIDLTDAIKEDWGGKPFVDLRKGWQYILDNYPQVSIFSSQALLCAQLRPVDR